MAENKIDQESMHTVTNNQGVLIGILRRDPSTGKHLVYLVQEAACTDIADLIGEKIYAKKEE
jgi:hypothetical protein